MDFHTCVLGAGLAGLGCARELMKEGKTAIVLERTEDPFANGKKDQRYDINMPASYKSAGMMELFVPGTSILNYFMKETRKVYDELGVPVHNGGMILASKAIIPALLSELLFDKETYIKSELKALALFEPQLRIENLAGAYREAEASSANPEDTMEKLMSHCKTLGVDIRFQQDLVSIERTGDNRWKVQTKQWTILCENIIVAAGPGSKDIMRKFFQLILPTKNVYGIITEIVPPPSAPSPYLHGLIMGARSAWHWAVDDLLEYVGDDKLEVTRYEDERKKLTTHLYISLQKGNMFVGGPRIALRDYYTTADLDLKLYKTDMEDTIRYAKEIINIPEDATEKGRWGGMMSFPEGPEYPFLGEADAEALPGIYLCTGFASSGFREAVGAAAWLVRCITQNGGKLLVEGTGCDPVKCAKVLPKGRVLRSTMGCCTYQ